MLVKTKAKAAFSISAFSMSCFTRDPAAGPHFPQSSFRSWYALRGHSCCLWHPSPDSVPGLWFSCKLRQCLFIPPRLPVSGSTFYLLFLSLSFAKSALLSHAGPLAFLSNFLLVRMTFAGYDPWIWKTLLRKIILNRMTEILLVTENTKYLAVVVMLIIFLGNRKCFGFIIACLNLRLTFQYWVINLFVETMHI